MIAGRNGRYPAKSVRDHETARHGTGHSLDDQAAGGPDGGRVGRSGLGREGGPAAIESYTELKTVLLPFTDEMM